MNIRVHHMKKGHVAYIPSPPGKKYLTALQP